MTAALMETATMKDHTTPRPPRQARDPYAVPPIAWWLTAAAAITAALGRANELGWLS